MISVHTINSLINLAGDVPKYNKKKKEWHAILPLKRKKENRRRTATTSENMFTSLCTRDKQILHMQASCYIDTRDQDK